MELTERQARAALDHTTSKCVTAGAGTGKTHVLVQKYINLLEGGASVGSILALTFTEKAAAEMKVRVRRAIAEKEGEQIDVPLFLRLRPPGIPHRGWCWTVLHRPRRAGSVPAPRGSDR